MVYKKAGESRFFECVIFVHVVIAVHCVRNRPGPLYMQRLCEGGVLFTSFTFISLFIAGITYISIVVPRQRDAFVGNEERRGLWSQSTGYFIMFHFLHCFGWCCFRIQETPLEGNSEEKHERIATLSASQGFIHEDSFSHLRKYDQDGFVSLSTLWASDSAQFECLFSYNLA